jgi:hypothetical protein
MASSNLPVAQAIICPHGGIAPMSNDDITRRTFVSATVGGIAAAAAGASASSRSWRRLSTSRHLTARATRHSSTPPRARTPPSSSGPMRSGSVRPCGRWRNGLAGEGYSVLVPNPFYRVSKAPQFEDASNVNFANERGKMNPLMGSINAEGTVEKDAPAFVTWLDQQKEVDRRKKIGTQGLLHGRRPRGPDRGRPYRVGSGQVLRFTAGGSSRTIRTARIVGPEDQGAYVLRDCNER